MILLRRSLSSLYHGNWRSSSSSSLSPAVATFGSLTTMSKSTTTTCHDTTGFTMSSSSFVSRYFSSSSSSSSKTPVYFYNNNNNNNHHEQQDDDNSFFQSSSRLVLVMGSSGSLGQTIAKFLHESNNNHDDNRRRRPTQVIGADVVSVPNQDEYLHSFIEMPSSTLPESSTESLSSTRTGVSLTDTTVALVDGLAQILDSDGNDDNDDNDHHHKNNQNLKNVDLDAMICVAGGWEGDPTLPSLNNNNNDNTTADSWIQQGAIEYAQTIERMTNQNLYPLLAMGYAANYYLTDQKHNNGDNSNGLFVAIGATVALGPTPGMLGYGLAKSSTHHFIQTIGELTDRSITTKSRRQLTRKLRLENNGTINSGMSVIGILPTTIDTPMNRQNMPDADFTQWTKSIDIAHQIKHWMDQPILRPHSGSLVKVFPKKKKKNKKHSDDGDDDDDDSNSGNGAVFQLAR